MRIFYPYGEKDNQTRLIPTIITKVINNETIEILSSGFQKLDFIYVRDIAEAYLKLIRNIEKVDNLTTFNIGSGFPYSIREVIYIIEDILSRKLKVKYGDENKDISISYADISKSRQLLEWIPKYSLEEGLRFTIEYYLKTYDRTCR